ncbi:MAG: hypothetical protein KGQ49_05375 [Verrucomicrobia bacterium]|nr:hypothetical protein [Verrucomicrobiota bacterium]
MKQILSESQTAFFTNHGFIEFEIPHRLPAVSAQRDQWRDDDGLKQFILKTLGPVALALTHKKQLRLGVSLWVTGANRPKQAGKLKEWVSLQNIAMAISLAPHPTILAKRSSLGILPLPAHAEQALFFRPDLILDWPHGSSDLFLILFTLPNGVYIHNPKDPETTYLKALGIQYGDVLQNATHPLIHEK